MARTGLELVRLLSTHFMNRKSCMPSQDSSIIMKVLPCWESYRYLTQHYCLMMRFFTELLCMAIFLTFLNRMFKSFFRTSYISLSETSRPPPNLTSYWIDFAESTNPDFSFSSQTILWISCLVASASSSFFSSSSNILGLFSIFFNIWDTLPYVILNSRAISSCLSYSIIARWPI